MVLPVHTPSDFSIDVLSELIAVSSRGSHKEVYVIRKDRVGVELYTEELLVTSEDTAYELGVFRSRHKPHLSSNRAYGNKAVERGVFGT